MNDIKTVRLTVVSLDDDGQDDTGIDFYWTHGAHVVLVSEWEYRCSGNTYTKVAPDPIGEDNLLDYFLENWQGRDGKHYVVREVEAFS